jgi:NADPH-dependent ferric siderophore reductase
VRLVFDGELEGFSAGAFTDHYVKLTLPPPGAGYAAPFDQEEIRASHPREQWPRTRTYTVSDWDPVRELLSIDFVVHGDEGIAGPWAARAKPGDRVQLRGPGGAYTPDPEADRYLLAGDPSVIPAITASLRRIPPGRPVRVLLQVADAADELALVTDGDLQVTWIRSQDDSALVDVLCGEAWPDGKLDAFVHGEASSVRALRKFLLVDHSLPREQLSASGYWKRARTEDGWREDKPEWKRLAEADLAQGAG